ncbi:MAG: T9SS type A sorting domain-containing protein [Cytophagaceae bacterium]
MKPRQLYLFLVFFLFLLPSKSFSGGCHKWLTFIYNGVSYSEVEKIYVKEGDSIQATYIYSPYCSSLSHYYWTKDNDTLFTGKSSIFVKDEGNYTLTYHTGSVNKHELKFQVILIEKSCPKTTLPWSAYICEGADGLATISNSEVNTEYQIFSYIDTLDIYLPVSDKIVGTGSRISLTLPKEKVNYLVDNPLFVKATNMDCETFLIGEKIIPLGIFPNSDVTITVPLVEPGIDPLLSFGPTEEGVTYNVLLDTLQLKTLGGNGAYLNLSIPNNLISEIEKPIILRANRGLCKIILETGPSVRLKIVPDKTLIIEGGEISELENGFITIYGSQEKIMYTVFIGKDKISEPKEGNGDKLKILIPDNVLTVGNNEILIVASSTDTTVFLDQTALIQVNPKILNISLNTGTGKVSIYPNPAKDYLVIENLDIIPGLVHLINSLGETVYSCMLSGKIDQLNISSFPSGTYILKFVSDNSVVTESLIILNH